MADPTSIRGLPAPDLLTELIATSRWKQPDEATLCSVVPMVPDPFDFLLSTAAMESESRTFIADDPETSKLFREYRGNSATDHPDLPWLDIDRAFFIAVNRNIGDDVAIALDFRSSVTDPRVTASEWQDDGVWWHEVSPTFTEFVRLIRV